MACYARSDVGDVDSGSYHETMIIVWLIAWGVLVGLDLSGLVRVPVYDGWWVGWGGALALTVALDTLAAVPMGLSAWAVSWLVARWWSRSGDAEEPLAGLLVAGPGLVLLGVVSFRGTRWILANVHDHVLGAGLLTVSVLAAVAILPTLARAAAKAITARAGWLVRPWWLPWAVGLGAPAAGLMWLGEVMGWGRLPWQPAFAALLVWALGLAVLPSRHGRPGPEARPRLLWALAAITLLPIGATWALGSVRPVVTRVVRGTWAAARVISAAKRLSDLDGDGYSSLFAGGDCAPLDPDIHPGAADPPGDGVDSNCDTVDTPEPVPFPGPRYLTPAPWPGRWSFLLLVMDAVRADHVSFLGYHRDTTPTLRALADQGAFRFARAYSPSATTRYSIPALLAGRHPSSLAWRRKGRNLFLRRGARENLSIATRLGRAGVLTAAVTMDYDIFLPSFGIGDGFERYDYRTVRFGKGHRTIAGRSAAKATDAVLAAIDEAGDRPFFVYCHYMDPHAPYDADPAGRGFGPSDLDRYDDEIRYTDSQIGRLLAGLRERGVSSRTIVVVTADHGDQFMERGRKGHGRFVYDEETHVPLLVYVPGVGGRLVETQVSLLDVAPMISNLAGVRDGWDLYEGRNLLELLTDGPRAGMGPVVVETWPFAFFRERRVALVQMPYKLIFDASGARWELYRLDRDPGEREDLFPLSGPGSDMVQTLARWLALHPLPRP